MFALLVIIILFTLPFTYQLVWNVGVVGLLDYLNFAIPTINYGIAFLMSFIMTFFSSRKYSNDDEDIEELTKILFRAYINKWVIVGIICLISAMVF